MKKPLVYLYIAWLISCVATLGSILLGEISQKSPCILCWLQRICMFPLAYILSIAFVKKNVKILPYVILFPILGMIFSLYHVAVQEIPSLEPVRLCGMGPSCATKIDLGIGFISFPMLSFVAFTLILIFLSQAYKKSLSSS